MCVCVQAHGNVQCTFTHVHTELVLIVFVYCDNCLTWNWFTLSFCILLISRFPRAIWIYISDYYCRLQCMVLKKAAVSQLQKRLVILNLWPVNSVRSATETVTIYQVLKLKYWYVFDWHNPATQLEECGCACIYNTAVHINTRTSLYAWSQFKED